MRAHRTLSTTSSVVVLAFLALLGTGTHTVNRGETLAGVALGHRTTVAALVQANGISNPNRILAGTRLTLPGAVPAAATAPAPATTTYRVQRGDTLGSIASKAGTSIASLVARNGIKNPNLVRIGQVLSLPAVTAGASASPATPAAPTTTTPPAGGATQHVVRSGETISGIAARYAISQAQLITANGLTDGRVYVGQRLALVPSTEAAPAPAAAGVTHTIAPGQTLSSIAQRYGTTIRAIQDANGITDPNLVVVGQVLKIPSTSGGSTSLVCPIQGPMRHMNDWGFPRSGGRFHEGNDLFAARGAPAAAVVAGTALQTVGQISGKQVKLTGDDGVTYYYTHLGQFGTAGRVSAGAVIGYVGNTGNAAGGPTHVHFEVHPGGGAGVNPYARISAAC